ncbi:MAG TPA: type VI secretion system-associated FHA domain protein TagH, partial [Burkholderiaceae bacterium]
AEASDPFSFLNKPAAAAPAPLPHDFDPFANLAPAASASKPPASPAPPQVGANDLLGSVGAGSGTPPSIDTSFGLTPVAHGAPDPLADFLAAPSPGQPGKPMAGAGHVSTDPLAMFGGSPAPAAPAAHAAFNHTPELNAAYQPPRVAGGAPPPSSSVDDVFAGLGLGASPVASSSDDALASFLGQPAPPAPAPAAASVDVDIPITAPAVRRAAVPQTSTAAPLLPAQPMPPIARPAGTPPAAPATSAAVDRDALWLAFCEGAGIRVNLPQGLNPEQMRIVGQVMREAVEGALHLMSVRATAKTELRAAVTTIRAKNNNPLKFSPNAQAALEQLLQPPLRGFMAGPVAMRDAMHDLVGHSIGTMAGMRAALAGVLARFEPGQLERKLAAKSVIDSLLPMNRKAKLWDLYLQHYSAIRDEAQDDFHTLFGAAFVAAYEDQLDRMQPPGHDAGT